MRRAAILLAPSAGSRMTPDKIRIGHSRRPKLSRDGRTMVVSIPISFRRQGGRKKVVTPLHAPAWAPPPPRVDNTIIKALVRAHRWRNMLEASLFPSVRELERPTTRGSEPPPPTQISSGRMG
jgi:hypothetical protein